MAEHARQTVYEELLDALLLEPELEGFLAAAAEISAQRLGLAAPGGCSIAVERIRRPRLSAPSLGLSGPVPDLEYGTGSPGDTVLGGGPGVVIRDLAADQQWPGTGAAAAAGLRSAIVLPLHGNRGALSCYSDRPGLFDERETQRAKELAAETAKVLRLALLLDARAHRAANLQAALESRTVVDLAAGIIMGQNGCSQQAAIDILRSVSNTRNIKIRNVAAGVVSAVSDRVNTHFDE
ncbi:GAF and ANTAR domain-containing protein [Arthrobacter zhangbolii]|uniref:GAF and ANTAR domain-containing protein n=1 Tax=Arthrobacter zhangbolii TaxID=2886936 RepID=A0A9X1M9R8_9MICC|nr:GAF and ANTAR domain-containing protein [Arthrobacter zhangbolii]MCC3272899.1 GAF and ANTAR domain-containing protein [Arthrobacter zhangbolii]UON92956.1 GAF and ANTAR domain-containing protein [Arthrobacter zhangbolii]